MSSAEAALSRIVMVDNVRGLHARASAKFVRTVQDFDAQVRVRRGSEVVDADSIMDLLMLGAGPGSELEIQATGPQAEAALDALAELVESKFGEGV